MSEKPIRSEADLKQRKVWTPQGDILSRTALQLVGVTPVMLPLADVYTALQTGLVDTVAAPPMAAIASRRSRACATTVAIPSKNTVVLGLAVGCVGLTK